MSEKRHPGITMHKLPVGGGIMGILFAVGSAVIFILGFPTLWYFVVLSAGLGVAIALLIRFVHQHSSDRSRPLSIFTAEEPAEQHSQSRRQRRHGIFRTLPNPTGA